MSIPATMLDYAPPGLELPADRLLRWIVAWSAIVYGGLGIIGAAVRVLLAFGWAADPGDQFYGAFEATVAALGAVFMAGMLIGGSMILMRSHSGILILRVGIACSLVLFVAEHVWNLRPFPHYAQYWLAPATTAINFFQSLDPLWLPILLALLTLPPLSKRVV